MFVVYAFKNLQLLLNSLNKYITKFEFNDGE